jgi:hypothetical protein
VEFLTSSEAVRRFRMHPATVLRLILTQRVSAHKDGNGRWLVRRCDLERWNAQRVRRAPVHSIETHEEIAATAA